MLLGCCQNCIYFAEQTTTSTRRGKDGECRRYAPTALHGGVGSGWSEWEWPTVQYGWFCGEWSVRADREPTP